MCRSDISEYANAILPVIINCNNSKEGGASDFSKVIEEQFSIQRMLTSIINDEKDRDMTYYNSEKYH